jgi:fluoride exporter
MGGPRASGWRWAAIALGGGLGATLRWAVLATVEPAGDLPWPVLALNVVGSFLLGVLLAEEARRGPRARVLLHDAGAIGFCGGLTTFSTFALDITTQLRDDAVGAAALYTMLSVVLALGALVAGAALRHRVTALAAPLEEKP